MVSSRVFCVAGRSPMMGWPPARANAFGVVEQSGGLDDVDGLGAGGRDRDGPDDDFVTVGRGLAVGVGVAVGLGVVVGVAVVVGVGAGPDGSVDGVPVGAGSGDADVAPPAWVVPPAGDPSPSTPSTPPTIDATGCG